MDERMKLPPFLRYFLIIYAGITGVMLSTRVDMGVNIGGKIFYIVSLSIFTALAVYGGISLYEDLTKEGWGEVVRKIRRFFNL